MSGSARESRFSTPHMPRVSPSVLAHDAHEPVAVARITGHGTVLDVASRGIEVVHAAVADVTQERRLVQEPQHEVRVVLRERVELEPPGVEPVHWCSAQNGSTVRSTKDILR